jgi:hypothetical protein
MQGKTWRRRAVCGAAVGWLAFVVASAQAAQTEDWWLVASGVDGERVSSDLASLQCKDQVCSIWEMTVYGAPGPDGVAFVRDLADYNCASRETRTRAETSFNASAQQMAARRDDASSWRPVATATLGQKLMAFACRDQTATGQRELSEAAVAFPAPPPVSAKPVPAGSGRIKTQVGAAATAAAADTTLAQLRRRDPARLEGLATRTEAAQVGGRPVYRAVVAGFVTSKTAQAFCRWVRNGGGVCFVRPNDGR